MAELNDLRGRLTALPGYMLRQQDGIFVDLSIFPVGGKFADYIDRLFGDGLRFQGVDYGVLSGLLYEYDAMLDNYGISAKVKLASDIVDFPPERKALYKGVKVEVDGSSAAYLFEPVSIEVVTEEPVYGEPGADGTPAIVGSAQKTELVPTKLDLDEFVADMWLKGVRYGISVGEVAGVIARGETVRMEVALQRDETPGHDAEIEEVSDALHRDNSPKKLANGKADLRKYQNRFPQIASGSRLLKKKKRVLGTPGFKVSGVMIEPPLPSDFDLADLAGEGTRVENQEGFEFIVAGWDGFLSLDVGSNHIAITEKIENKGGISVRTTGDISLSGNDFIEHGEVQEGRIVEGKNMTFRSDVYGDIVSQGGLILIEKNLSGGSAKSNGGNITLNGRALNSLIEAWDGVVTLKYAEGCLIMGASVVIERAVNCEIIAESVQVGISEGCGIAGKNVQIKSSNTCRDKETLVFMLVPDLTGLDAQIGQQRQEMDDCNKTIKAKRLEMDQIKADEGVAKYLALATSIRQGVVKLSDTQQDSWHAMTAKFAKSQSAMDKLEAEMQEQLKRIQAAQQVLSDLLEERQKIGAGIHGEIVEIAGDTLVRSMVVENGIFGCRKKDSGELRMRLREPGQAQERILFKDTGSLDWTYVLPPIAG